MAAFQKAAELGADGVELDVRLSADGVPVVIHDATVESTTDGTGRVSEMTVAQLKRLDAGAYFDPAFAGERIPTLEEVLDAFGDRLLLNIELKGKLLDHGLERAVVDLIGRYALEERVLLSSFNPLALRRAQRLAPRIPMGILYTSKSLPLFGIARLLSPEPYTAFHPHHTIVNQTHITRAQRNNYQMHVWTVDDPARMRQFIAWGVDGIITNSPHPLHEILEAK